MPHNNPVVLLVVILEILCLNPIAAQITETNLTASDGSSYDWFGNSVSISGDYVLVGAPDDGDGGTNSGSVYVFRRDGSTWIQEAKLTASDGDGGDSFGKSVAIAVDVAIVGAPYDEDNGVNSGSAYVF